MAIPHFRLLLLAGLILLGLGLFVVSSTGLYPLTDHDRFAKKFNTLLGQLQDEVRAGQPTALLGDLIERYYTLKKDKEFSETDHGYRFRDLYFKHEVLFRLLLERWLSKGVYNSVEEMAADITAYAQAFPQAPAVPGFQAQLKTAQAAAARAQEKKQADALLAETDFAAYQKKLEAYRQVYGTRTASWPALQKRLEQLNIEYLKARHD